jgi:hypothetical protein
MLFERNRRSISNQREVANIYILAGYQLIVAFLGIFSTTLASLGIPPHLAL